MRRLALAALLVLATPAARAADGACAGTVAGAVIGEFTCSVTVRVEGERTLLEIATDGPVAGLAALAPASFELPSPLRPGTLTLATLGPGRARAVTDAGKAFAAAGTRGEVTLVIDQAERYPQARGFWVVSGTLRARLVPEGKGGEGELTLDVRF
jgi:hypothetical protein